MCNTLNISLLSAPSISLLTYIRLLVAHHLKIVSSIWKSTRTLQMCTVLWEYCTWTVSFFVCNRHIKNEKCCLNLVSSVLCRGTIQLSKLLGLRPGMKKATLLCFPTLACSHFNGFSVHFIWWFSHLFKLTGRKLSLKRGNFDGLFF